MQKNLYELIKYVLIYWRVGALRWVNVAEGPGSWGWKGALRPGHSKGWKPCEEIWVFIVGNGEPVAKFSMGEKHKLYFRKVTLATKEGRWVIITEHLICGTLRGRCRHPYFTDLESWSVTLERDKDSVLVSAPTALALDPALCCLQSMEWSTKTAGRWESPAVPPFSFSGVIFADLGREIWNPPNSPPLCSSRELSFSRLYPPGISSSLLSVSAFPERQVWDGPLPSVLLQLSQCWAPSRTLQFCFLKFECCLTVVTPCPLSHTSVISGPTVGTLAMSTCYFFLI